MGKTVIFGIGFIGGIFWPDDMRGDCGGDGCDGCIGGDLRGKFWLWCVDGATLAIFGSRGGKNAENGGVYVFLIALKNIALLVS